MNRSYLHFIESIVKERFYKKTKDTLICQNENRWVALQSDCMDAARATAFEWEAEQRKKERQRAHEENAMKFDFDRLTDMLMEGDNHSEIVHRLKGETTQFQVDEKKVPLEERLPMGWFDDFVGSNGRKACYIIYEDISGRYFVWTGLCWVMVHKDRTETDGNDWFRIIDGYEGFFTVGEASGYLENKRTQSSDEKFKKAKIIVLSFGIGNSGHVYKKEKTIIGDGV